MPTYANAKPRTVTQPVSQSAGQDNLTVWVWEVVFLGPRANERTPRPKRMRESCPEIPAGALMTVRSVSEIIKIDKFLYGKTKFGHSKAAFEVIARRSADKLLVVRGIGIGIEIGIGIGMLRLLLRRNVAWTTSGPLHMS